MRVVVHSAAGTESPATPAAAISIDSDMVVILASLLCALICVAGLALVARCACRRRRGAATTTTPPAATSPTPKGLKKKAIDALPTVSFALKQQQQQAAECAICLAEFAAGEELRLLPHCGHAFHVSCIDTWLGTHATCPSCRATVGTSTLFLPVPGRCRRCGEVDLPTLHDFSTSNATSHDNTPP
uniref:RING-type E3 ubiquitin transferase n=1 Tax=Oryza meridionalis TaxID=40149 RepID=A0A0E0CTJ9_9ORYZ